MALPFSSGQSKKRDHVISIDLGAHTTKAVQIQRRREGFSFQGYAVLEASDSQGRLSPEVLGPHLERVLHALGPKTRDVVLVLGVGDTLVRLTELPMVPVADMRVMLKYSSKTYLQQDLPDHVFDCHVMPARPNGKVGGPKTQPKARVLVAGARKKLVMDLLNASKQAKCVPIEVVPGMVAPANVFEKAQPETFANDAVALVDIGFRNTSISILLNGELVINRVVAIGGEKLTNGIAEGLGTSYGEAEGIKLGLPDEVESTLVSLLTPLGRELRASMDFFEHQHDRQIGKVYVSGGTAKSNYILQILHTELMVPVESWTPTTCLNLALPPQQMGELEQVAPQLTGAIGGALSAL